MKYAIMNTGQQHLQIDPLPVSLLDGTNIPRYFQNFTDSRIKVIPHN